MASFEKYQDTKLFAPSARYILRVWDTPPRLVRHIFNSSSVAFKRKSAVLRLPMCTRWMMQVGIMKWLAHNTEHQTMD